MGGTHTKPGSGTFNKWISWIFDHEVKEPAWYFDFGAQVYELSEEDTIQFLVKLFQEADKKLARFSDEQIKQGFNFIADYSTSGILNSLFSKAISYSERLKVIAATEQLYQKFFTQRCTNHLMHLEEQQETGTLNSICYKWWDIMPFFELSDRVEEGEEILDECLKVLRSTLFLSNDTCRESALHGLGRLISEQKRRIECQKIIDEFLETYQDIQPQLKTYALAAYRGKVQ